MESVEEIKKIQTELEERPSLECDVLYSGRISFQMNMLNLSSEQTTNIVTKGA
jgi:hypothetical protein